MAPVHALDRYYLGITILVTIGWQALGFLIAWTLQVLSAQRRPVSKLMSGHSPFQFDKITDFTGGV